MPLAGPVLVTGASGFAGRCLVADLRRAGQSVVGLGLAPADRGASGHLPCDITDRPALEAAIRRVRPTVTYHLAAVAAPQRAAQNQRLAWEVNLIGTLNLLDSLSTHAAGSRLLFVSSAAVYGQVERSACPLDECFPPAPRDCYAATKLAGELAVRGRPGSDLEVLVARPFNHLGPGQSPDFLPGKLARQIARIATGRERPALSLGDLSDWRDYCDVRDVVGAYRAIVSRGRPGQAYNVCSGRAIAITDLVDRFAAHAGCRLEITSRGGGGSLPYLEGSNAKIATECGWAPVIELEQSIADSIDYELNNLPGPAEAQSQQ